MALLEIRDLDVHYGAIHALKGVNITVEERQIVTLIGANGAGKSTTLRAISGLVRASRGTISFAGKSLAGVAPHEIVRDQVHVSFIDDEYGIAHLADLPVDRVHWQCDFPHADSSWPHSRDELGARLRDVDASQARTIAGANTAQLLRL